MTQETAADALAVAVWAKAPVILWGGPGTGKSAVVHSLGDALGRPIVTVIASLREPADFAGLPVVTADGSVRLAEPTWARDLAESGDGVLFLDEVTTAPPAVQAALLRVVLERVVGDVRLPDGVAIIAAANPPDMAAGAWDLSAPLANRFCHIDWAADAGRYLEALSTGWPIPNIAFGKPEPDPRLSGQIRATVGGFLKSRPALLHAMPQDVSNAGRAWPSPRSWDLATRLWVAAEQADRARATVLTLIAGCIGAGPARELLVWQEEADLPDPEEVLRNPEHFRLPDRGDRQFAILSALTAAVALKPTKERWEAAFKVVEQAVERGAADVAAVAARTLAKNVPEGLEAFPPAVLALAPVLDKAGLLRRPSG
jgi:hypothetical protein